MSNGSDQETPGEVTMKDLWRLISGFRNHVDARFTEVDARFDATDAKIDAVRDELKEETQAIREVLDTLPSEDDFQELDRKVAVIANDTKATRMDVRNLKSEVSRLKEDVRKSGIPVR